MQFLSQTCKKLRVRLTPIDRIEYADEPDANYWVHVESLDDEKHTPVFSGQTFEKLEDARLYFNGLCWGLKLSKDDGNVECVDETLPVADEDEDV